MRSLKSVLGAAVLGAAAVLPAATPAQAASCSVGANPLPFNTCTTPIPCNAPTVSVKVAMTGTGSVTGTAWCGQSTASCTAFGPPSGSCASTMPATPGVILRCTATVTGVVVTWQVTCSSP